MTCEPLKFPKSHRARYADNLTKELPRIPAVKRPADFWAFSKAGRDLAELHLNYETVEPYPVNIQIGGANSFAHDPNPGRMNSSLQDADYRVEKMRYGKNGKDKVTSQSFPEVPTDERTPCVVSLLGVIEALRETVQRQEEEIGRLSPSRDQAERHGAAGGEGA
jgi:hypothetical protein